MCVFAHELLPEPLSFMRAVRHEFGFPALTLHYKTSTYRFCVKFPIVSYSFLIFYFRDKRKIKKDTISTLCCFIENPKESKEVLTEK